MAVVHLPKSLENRSTTTSLVGIPGRPCLRWTSRNVFFVTQRKNEKLPKPWGTYPLYLGVFPNNSAQRCSNINDARRLMRISLKRRRVLLEIDLLTDLHAKEVMYHASSYRKYTSPKSLDSVAIIQRLSPMTATRHGFQMSYLNDRGVDHLCLLYYESIKPHCAICMASYCEMNNRKKLSEGTVWRARVTWSKGTLTWDWSFTDLTSVQIRSMCTAEKYSQGQLLRDVWGWTRHKKEKKKKSWRWNGVPDELSRSGEWGLCALRHGIQISMEAILACHPVRSTEWLKCHPKSCELWRIRTGPIRRDTACV